MIAGFSKCFSSSFITAGFLVALLSDCVDLLFLDVLLFRSCRSDKLPFCVFKSSFSRIILCFDLRNIVGTLWSASTWTSIGNFPWKMPSQASRSLQLQDIYIRSDYVQKPGSNSYGLILQPLVAILDSHWFQFVPLNALGLRFIERGILHLKRACFGIWHIEKKKITGEARFFGIWLIERAILHLNCASSSLWLIQRGMLHL